jgi:PadR family transcriptional regulator, regulatory protein PadR
LRCGWNDRAQKVGVPFKPFTIGCCQIFRMAEEILLNHVEVLTIVAITRLGDAAYGVTIREDIGECAGRDVSMAAVYAALDRLERYGLVKTWMSEPRRERGGRARRHYHLTAAGRATLRREGSTALRMWKSVLPPLGGDR